MRHTLALDVSDSAAVLRQYRKGTWQELGEIGLQDQDPAAARERLRGLLRGSRAGARDLVLRWSPELSLRRTIKMPAAAGENLREVLSFEMDRYTPFKAEDVYYGYVQEDSDNTSDHLTVELFVVPNATAIPILQTVRSWGLDPDRLTVSTGTGATEAVEVLPAGVDITGARPDRPVVVALAICSLLFGMGTIYLEMSRQQSELAILEAQLSRAQAERMEIDRLRQEIDELEERNRFVVDRKRMQPSAMEILTELTRVLPDDSWSFDLSVQGENITVSGFSTKASDLIRRLEQSDLFSQVSFTSPVTQDTGLDAERFSISAATERR